MSGTWGDFCGVDNGVDRLNEGGDWEVNEQTKGEAPWVRSVHTLCLKEVGDGGEKGRGGGGREGSLTRILHMNDKRSM